MLARACLVLALLGGSSALVGCTDTGLVGEVMPLSTPSACRADKDCDEDERCGDQHTCVPCERDECEPPAQTDAGCGPRDAACPQCTRNGDCTSDALPYCVEQTCVACREDDDCGNDAKCDDGACVPEDDDEIEHQDDGTAGKSDDNSGPGSMEDGEAGSGGSDDGP